MNNIKNLIIICLIMSSQTIKANNNQIGLKSNNKEQLKKETKVKYKNILEEKAKLIPESHKNLLNVLFEKYPIYTLKLQSVYKITQQIINLEHNITEKDVAIFKMKILKPIETIIPLLHQKGYRFINEPMFTELLLENELKNKIKASVKQDILSLDDIYNNMDEKNIPIALKFLKADEASAKTFFHNYIKDAKTLIDCSKELEKIFGPLNKILTEKTKQVAVIFYKNLMTKQKSK